MIRIEEWAIVTTHPNSPYRAPELGYRQLRGIVYGHPLKEDGSLILTSPIILTHKLFVATKSGHIYKLGQPNELYLAWLNKMGLEFNSEEPLRIIGAIL